MVRSIFDILETIITYLNASENRFCPVMMEIVNEKGCYGSPYKGGWCQGGVVTVDASGTVCITFEWEYGNVKYCLNTGPKYDINALMVEKSIKPAIGSWLEEKVAKEDFGGFYDINVSFLFNFTGFNKNPFCTGDHQFMIQIQSDKRFSQLLEHIEYLIEQGLYLDKDRTDIGPFLFTIARYAPLLLHKIGHEKMIDLYDTLLAAASKGGDEQAISAIASGFYDYVLDFNQSKLSEIEDLFFCHVGKAIMVYSIEEIEREYGFAALMFAKQVGSKTACEILKEFSI